MKKKKYFTIAILLILLLLIAYGFNYSSLDKRISRDLRVFIPSSLKFEYEDSHDRFLGDGITSAKAKLTDIQISKMIENSDTKWIKTPMTSEVKQAIYNGKQYEQGREEQDKAKYSVDNGYWIFKNRTPKGRFEDTTSNYSVGIIDLDTNIFYYIKFDS